MGIYVCCDIRVSEDNKVKIDIFDYDGDWLLFL
jgi:predicted YcjX-like family ATPase